ncbi:Hypothetical protein A7982_06031 [Minicystis rosea]|nr:Hypothetical protein A7982_06031 [Minicystis rosea]
MWLQALERFAVAAPTPRSHRGPACELCGGAIDAAHAHVADLDRRSIQCACRACALLFAGAGAGGGRRRTVPTRVLVDPMLSLTEAQWAALGVPVRLAFFLQSSALGRWLAIYPSPAGATEAELDTAAWTNLAAASRLIACVEPDVEALLLRAERGRRFEAMLAPIDVCYEIVGIVRRQWKGFDGGDAVRAALDACFDDLRARSRPLDAGPGKERA